MQQVLLVKLPRFQIEQFAPHDSLLGVFSIRRIASEIALKLKFLEKRKFVGEPLADRGRMVTLLVLFSLRPGLFLGKQLLEDFHQAPSAWGRAIHVPADRRSMVLELQLKLHSMSNCTLVILGNLASGALNQAIAEFPWSLEDADGFRRLSDLHRERRVVAVLFEPYTFDLTWNEALRSVREAAPTALPIACHRFSDVIDWPQLAEGGAFHALRLPFDERELRQSLGFVWTAWRQEPLKLSPRSAEKARVHHRSNARAAGF